MTVTGHGQRIGSLETTVTDHGTQIGLMQSSLTSLQGDVAGLKERVGGLEQKTKDLSKGIAASMAMPALSIPSGKSFTFGMDLSTYDGMQASVRRVRSSSTGPGASTPAKAGRCRAAMSEPASVSGRLGELRGACATRGPRSERRDIH